MTDYTGKTPNNTPVVSVEWQDFQTAENWNEDDVPETYGAVSVGWLLEESKTSIVIATTYSYEDERWSGYFTLPKLPPEVTVLVEAGGE